jgi:tRNA G10  N-methylase Trm11
MTYRYAFVLGRVYTLSLAELFFYFQNHGWPLKIIDLSHEVLVVETDQQIEAAKVQRELGGVIKILKVLDEVKKKDTDYINFALQHYFKPSKLKRDFLGQAKGKIQFGVSVYLLDPAINAFGEPKRLGMFIKRGMQDGGSSIRLVLPQFNGLALASVVVTHNNLLTKGAEICVLAAPNKLYVAKTLSVQDFEDYGRRDYQRPVRDDKQGMIPPKVAQMMVNFAGAKPNATLLDPFCGIGTVVQEGVLQGYRMLGTDINPAAIAGSEKNLEWFRNRYKIAKGKFHVEVSDAAEVSKIVANLKKIGAFTQVDGIVTEGTLGPMYSEFPSPAEIKQNFKDLTELYTKAFQDYVKFLSTDSKVVMCLPAYKKNDQYIQLENLDFIKDIGYNLVDLIPNNLAASLPFLKLTDRGTAIYDRKDQIVAREIIIFSKN